jgi:cobalt-zinc-cadmium efflux system outer membrane protein
VLNTAAANFQKTVDFHAAQLSAGAISEQDLLRVRLEHERLKISADVASIDAKRARVDLLREMGATDFPELILTESWDAAAPAAIPEESEILGHRADIRAARAALEQARAAARLQDISARPDLNVTYGYKRTQLPDSGEGINTAIASVRVTLPFTDKNQGNRAAAAAEVRRAEQQLAAVEADVRAGYRGALQEYRMRRAEFENMLQPLREHAGAIEQIAAAAYAEGGTDLLRLLDSERVRLEAELAWTRGMIEYRQSMVRLEAAAGVNP